MAIEGGWEAINLEKSSEVSAVLEERGIVDDDIKLIIHNAETTEEKMYKPETGECLAKLLIGETTFHVQYTPKDEQNYTIHTAFWFKSKIEEED
jgi:hypothetical protein